MFPGLPDMDPSLLCTYSDPDLDTDPDPDLDPDPDPSINKQNK
jgi:hypothetical protein